MLAGLFTILVGGSYHIVKNTIDNKKEKEVNDRIKRERDAIANEKHDFISKYTDKNQESIINNIVNNMSVNEQISYIYNKLKTSPYIYDYPDYLSFSEKYISTVNAKYIKMCKRLMLADRGLIPYEDAYWGVASSLPRYGLSSEWGKQYKKDWNFEFLFMQCWDNYLKSKKVEPMLYYSNRIDSLLKEHYNNNFDYIKDSYVSSVGYIPEWRWYYWWPIRWSHP